MKPFSDNIIFWDTEFSSLNPYKGELLSMGFIKNTGEELYFELDFKGEADPWVKENIIPHLILPKITGEDALKKIDAFLGNSKPYLVAYVNQFDTIYFFKLLKVKDSTKVFPFHWIPVDFASMLFALGVDPEQFSTSPERNKLALELGIDPRTYKSHNALDDARLLKDVYSKLVK
jgi:DNA polymerase III epsilon subunit-like protein